jgi:hypothetical protein
MVVLAWLLIMTRTAVSPMNVKRPLKRLKLVWLQAPLIPDTKGKM